MLVAAVTAVFACNPTAYMRSVTDGLEIWVSAVVPALFPFFVFSKLLTDLGFFRRFTKFMTPVVKKLFKAPAASGYIFIVSVISGYPVGAKMIQGYYRKGLLTETQCRKTATFTSTSGPLFILGTVGAKFLGGGNIGGVLLVCHIMSAMICGLLFRGFYIDDTPAGEQSDSAEKGNPLGDSVYSAITGIMSVGAFICLFYMLIDMILSLSAADAVLSGHPAVSAFLTGLMEVTRGCKQISAVLPLPAAAVLCGTLISFGGMCVFAQSFVYLKECGVSFRQLLAVKCLQASVAASLTFAAVSILY